MSELELSRDAGASAGESPGHFLSLGNRNRLEGGDYPIRKHAFVQTQQWKIRLHFTRCKAGPVKTQDSFQALVEIAHSGSEMANRIILSPSVLRTFAVIMTQAEQIIGVILDAL